MQEDERERGPAAGAPRGWRCVVSTESGGAENEQELVLPLLLLVVRERGPFVSPGGGEPCGEQRRPHCDLLSRVRHRFAAVRFSFLDAYRFLSF